MKRVVLSLLLLSMAVLTGCATQGPVALDKSYWENKPDSVGVIVAKMPNVGSHKRGAQGLLDVAINNAMANSLDQHLNSLKLDEFREAGHVIANHFSQQGVPAKFIEEEIDLSTVAKVKKAPKGTTPLDFASLKAKYGVDQLVVLQVEAAGTIRGYYGFIPLTDPQGYFVCKGTLVNLQDNKILWLGTGTKEVVVDEPWDQEATQYPHITAALYQALEGAKTDMLRTLMSADGKVSARVN